MDASGQPAPGADVALFKRADIGEVLIGATLAIGTLGLSCFADNGPDFCKNARKAKTDGDGAFAFELKGRDTQGSVANANDFDLTAVVRRAAGDLVASVRFKIQRSDLDVPPLRVWEAATSVVKEGTALRVSWPALPGVYGPSASYGIRFVDTAGQRIAWNVADTRPGNRVDGRLVEDRRGNVEVAASASMPGPDTTFRYTYFAQGSPFTGVGGPPSRGVACLSTNAAGQAAPISPCRLSDGDLYSTADLGSDDLAARTGAYLDLGASKAISLVVARGAVGTTVVETSDDAATWTTLGPGAGSLVSVAAPQGARARYVRIRTTNNVDISSLTELSVWS